MVEPIVRMILLAQAADPVFLIAIVCAALAGWLALVVVAHGLDATEAALLRDVAPPPRRPTPRRGHRR